MADRPASVRVRLIRLADTAIAGSDGVIATDDARWVSSDGDRRISGVLAAEDGHGHVDLELHVIALWPPQPLERLAEDLRVVVVQEAATAGLEDRVGTIDVRIHDVQTPGTGA